MLENKRYSSVFKIRDVGYFDFNLNVFIIKMKENHNVYYNVFNFINYLRMKIDIININILK